MNKTALRQGVAAIAEEKELQRQRRDIEIAGRIADQLEWRLEKGRYTILNTTLLRIRRPFLFRNRAYPVWDELRAAMLKRGWVIHPIWSQAISAGEFDLLSLQFRDLESWWFETIYVELSSSE
jgi:hypothetical protein